MRISAGSTDRYIYFVAVDSSDLITRETGLSSFTVYYEIENGTATAMTTPTVTEASSANMPGVYTLLIDESGMTTLAAGHDTAELCLHITCSGMAPVTRVVEIYRPELTVADFGTAQAGGASSITLAATASATTGHYHGMTVLITAGTGVGQSRIIGTYNGGTKVATTDAAWATTPDSTSVYQVLPIGRADLRTIQGAAISTSSSQLGVNVVNAGGTAWGSGAITAASIASNAITSAKIATDAIGAAQIAADAIGSSELATSAVTEIQSGLSTLDAAAIRTAVGLASANLDTQLSTIDTVVDAVKAKTDNLPSDPADQSVLEGKIDTIDTVVDGIKAKTDSLTFTVAGQVDANAESVNGTAINGSGTAGDPWGP